MPPPFSPEVSLLRLCARGAGADEMAAALRAVSDWEALAVGLHWHRLTPLFLHQTRGEVGAAMPDALAARLRREGASLVAGNLELWAELRAVLEVLDAGGVRALCYKGPALALSAYGSLALRPFADLDLIVLPRDVGRVRAALRTLGYEAAPVKALPVSTLRAWRRGMTYETPLVSRSGVVDLHWNLAAPFESCPLDFEALWRARVAVRGLQGGWTLGGAELVVALCFHGLKHGWQHLEWIGALARVLDGAALDWDELSAQLGECERVLWLGVVLADGLGGAPLDIPARLRERAARDGAVQWAARAVWRDIGQAAPSSRDRYLTRALLGAGMRQGAARARFVAGMARLGAIYLGGRGG